MVKYDDVFNCANNNGYCIVDRGHIVYVKLVDFKGNAIPNSVQLFTCKVYD